jgi:hypothetical protein
MAERSGFFNARLQDGVYDRTYQAEDFADCLSLFIPNGIYVEDSETLTGTIDKTTVQGLKPYASGTSLFIKEGKAFINGYWYLLDEQDLEISLTVNTAKAIALMYVAADRRIRVELLDLVDGQPNIPKTDAQYGILLGIASYTSDGVSVTDLREDFMVGSPKSLQAIANQAQQTLRELKSSMSKLTPKNWQQYVIRSSKNFTENADGTAYIGLVDIFGKSVDEFTIECLYYDSDEDTLLPIPYVNLNDFGNVTIKRYFTYQITTDSKENVTARIKISKELYNFMEKNTVGRLLRIIFRRYTTYEGM